MKSASHGPGTSVAEVSAISESGVRLSLDGRDVFLSFRDFPWFEGAAAAHVRNVQRPSKDHLHWPDLDIDVSVESIEFPERFPLVSSVQPASARKD